MPKNTNQSQKPGRRHRKAELTFVVVFIGLHILVPMFYGEIFPFTVSPMFSDQPSQYCTYELFDSEDEPVRLESFGLHLVYDGNPPGLGVGIKPQPTLHEFGAVPEQEEIAQHIRQRMQNDESLPRSVKVVQNIVSPSGHQLETKKRCWQVSIERQGEVVQ